MQSETPWDHLLSERQTEAAWESVQVWPVCVCMCELTWRSQLSPLTPDLTSGGLEAGGGQLGSEPNMSVSVWSSY